MELNAKLQQEANRSWVAELQRKMNDDLALAGNLPRISAHGGDTTLYSPSQAELSELLNQVPALLRNYTVFKDHTDFINAHGYKIGLLNGFLERAFTDAVAIVRGDQILFSEQKLRAHLENIHTLGFRDAEAREALRFTLLPTLAHELRHRMTDLKMTEAFGFCLEGIREDEDAAYAEEVLAAVTLLRDPELNKFAISIFKASELQLLQASICAAPIDGIRDLVDKAHPTQMRVAELTAFTAWWKPYQDEMRAGFVPDQEVRDHVASNSAAYKRLRQGGARVIHAVRDFYNGEVRDIAQRLEERRPILEQCVEDYSAAMPHAREFRSALARGYYSRHQS